MRLLIFFILWFGQLSSANKITIRDYRPITPIRCIVQNGEELALLRRFNRNGDSIFLAVDTATLRTQLTKTEKSTPRECSGTSRYMRLLKTASAAPWPLQNDGITHGQKGLYLTTDLCPSSKKGYEDRLYKALIDTFSHPVPVTLFITRRWIEHHEPALKQLLLWQEQGKLAITWGNHTAWHHYHPGKPLNENFVLSPEENLTEDILELEKTLLYYRIVPSVFFRFPGLVSDRKAVKTVTRLGLVTVGTDAWLAKGQKPKAGSIILLHGNRNEPKGVDIFLKMIKEKRIKKLNSLDHLEAPQKMMDAL